VKHQVGASIYTDTWCQQLVHSYSVRSLFSFITTTTSALVTYYISIERWVYFSKFPRVGTGNFISS